MRTAAVAEAEVASGEAEGRIGGDISGIRAGNAWPEHRIDPSTLHRRNLRLNHRRARRCRRRIVAAADVDFDVAETALRQMRLQRGDRVVFLHVRNEAHVDLRYSAVGEDRFAARTGVAADES